MTILANTAASYLFLHLSFILTLAEVVELVDTLDSKSSALNKRVGSSPTFGTKGLVQD